MTNRTQPLQNLPHGLIAMAVALTGTAPGCAHQPQTYRRQVAFESCEVNDNRLLSHPQFRCRLIQRLSCSPPSLGDPRCGSHGTGTDQPIEGATVEVSLPDSSSSVSTDGEGWATVDLRRQPNLPDDVSQPWATVRYFDKFNRSAVSSSFTPAAKDLLGGLGSPAQFDAFKARFKGTPEWPSMEPEFRERRAQYEAEAARQHEELRARNEEAERQRIAAENAKREAREREHAEWRAAADDAVSRARTHVRRRQWDEAITLLQSVEIAPALAEDTELVVELKALEAKALQGRRKQLARKVGFKVPPEAKYIWQLAPDVREVIVSKELARPIRDYLSGVTVKAVAKYDRADTPVVVRLTPEGILVDVRLVKGPLPGESAAYCGGKTQFTEMFSPEAGQVAKQLCMLAWQSYIYYAFEVARQLPDSTPKERSLLKQWGVKAAGVRVWTPAGDSFYMAWLVRGGAWWTGGPSATFVSYLSVEERVPQEWFRLPPADARGNPTALGLMVSMLNDS